MLIESKQNQQVKYWKKLHKKKYRDQENLFLIEGWHLLEEAVKSHWQIDKIIIDESVTIDDKWHTHNFVKVTKEVFKELSQTETPQGVMAVVKQKKWQLEESDRKFVFLDGVQDPGNVGTIIRSALAFQVDGVVLGIGSADLFHDKVIRATQGALFHLPIYRGDLQTWLAHCKDKRIKTYATALDQNATPLHNIQNEASYAIIAGNEGQGITKNILNEADEMIYIPIATKSESLNVGVATSIVLYHFTQIS